VIAFQDDADYLNITKIWVYSDAAEEGYTEDEDCADCVIAVKGGSQAYNATGGDSNPKGNWTINTLTIDPEDAHVHSMQGHIQTLASSNMSSLAGFPSYIGAIQVGGIWYLGSVSENGGTSISRRTQIKLDTGGPSPGSTGATSHTHGATWGNSWRPQAAVGVMIFPAKIT
jgi:hypothetical protein